MDGGSEVILERVDGPAVGVEWNDQKSVKVRIQASERYSLGICELWEYRELVFFLIWREIKIRYKQTVLGAAWAIIQPFLTMLVFSLFFGRLAKVPSEGLPYPVFCYAALVPWTLFANGLLHGSNILVLNSGMVKKIYFPRLVLPVATVLSGLLDFFLALGVLVLMLLYYRIPLTLQSLWWPVFLVLTIMTSAGVAVWLSSLNAQFRDVRFAVPFLAQIWLFSTPIAYPSTLLSDGWRTLYGLNPMVSVVEGFRWALLGTETISSSMLLVSGSVAVTLLASGIVYFKRTERTLADIV